MVKQSVSTIATGTKETLELTGGIQLGKSFERIQIIIRMQRFLYILIIILFANCSSKNFFVKNGESKSNMYLYYCNDSLSIYAQFYGDFNQKEFSTKSLYRSDKYILSKSHFKKRDDKILFHSFTKLNPVYNVLGLVRKDFDRKKYVKKEKRTLSIYYRIYYGKYNSYEIIYPIKDYFFSVIFYEKNKFNENKIKNLIDYEAMEDYTLEALQRKYCGKENIANLANESFTEDKQGNYLSYKNIQNVESNYINTNEEGIYRQILSTYLSFAQHNEDAENEFNKLLGKTKNNEKFNSKPIELTSLIDTLKPNQVIFFNEAHHKPKHRYLVGMLLKPLYDAGFRYFGLEAFSEEESLNQLGFPTLDNGFYVREPTMGNLIREAKKIGFNIFEYDSEGKNREVEQAENIYNKTFKYDQNAKILILGGYSHIDEKDGWMAQQLNLKYNINPFTVNQTNYNLNKSSDKKLLEIVTPINKNFNCDLYLNNNLPIINNCFSSNDSKEFQIDLPIKITNYYVLLIYKKEEFEKINNPIPVFIKTLEKDQNNIMVNLCLGNYIIIVKSIQGTLKFENEININ